MSDISDYYLAHRFNVKDKQVSYEENDEKSPESLVSQRIGLKKDDFKWGMTSMTAERIDELVCNFKKNALSVDDVEISKHKVASREILYKQLAEAYAFGLSCFCSMYNKQYLDEVLCKYNLHHHVKPLVNDGYYNKWNAITALLYGEWEQVSEDEADGLKYSRDRSAEKYGCILYILDQHCIPTGKAAEYIANYTFIEASSGKKFKGMIAMQKAFAKSKRDRDNKKSKNAPTPRQIARRKSLIARGENAALNCDVFAMPKPAQLPDAVEFARMVVKRVDDEDGNSNLLIVGYETWERETYERYAYCRGRDAAEKEKAAQAKQDALAEATKTERGAIAINIQHDAGVTDLLNLGFTAEEILAAFRATVNGLKPKDVATSGIEQFVDKDPA